MTRPRPKPLSLSRPVRCCWSPLRTFPTQRSESIFTERLYTPNQNKTLPLASLHTRPVSPEGSCCPGAAGAASATPGLKLRNQLQAGGAAGAGEAGPHPAVFTGSCLGRFEQLQDLGQPRALVQDTSWLVLEGSPVCHPKERRAEGAPRSPGRPPQPQTEQQHLNLGPEAPPQGWSFQAAHPQGGAPREAARTLTGPWCWQAGLCTGRQRVPRNKASTPRRP